MNIGRRRSAVGQIVVTDSDGSVALPFHGTF